MWKDSIKESWRNLIRRPVQSALAVLGISFGIVGVLLLSTIGNGVTHSMNQQLQQIGPGLMTVIATPQTNPANKTTELRMMDYKNLTMSNLLGSATTPLVEDSEIVSSGSKTITTSVIGVSANFPTMRPMTLLDGHFYNDLDEREHMAVAVLGSSEAKELFPDESAVGRTVYVGQNALRVIGVCKLQSQGQAGDINQLIFVPATTVLLDFSTTQVLNAILIKVPNPNQISLVQDQVLSTLAQQRRWTVPPSAFTVYTQTQILKSSQQMTGLIKLFVHGAVAIAFMVGGTGIMNVMLMAATQRRREIGLYLAFGAQRWRICAQFLLESVWISLLGVVLGSLGGTLGGLALEATTGLPWLFDLTTYALVIGAGVLTGIVFGIYPSLRASTVVPANAIRS